MRTNGTYGTRGTYVGIVLGVVQNLWWGEAPKRDQAAGIFSPSRFVFSTREAAWPSRGWDTAIRVSSFITLRLDRFPLRNTLLFKPEGQRDT